MDEDEAVELTPLFDDEPWRAWGALGPAWMIKWTTRCHGYELVVTDGVRGFIERRDAQYVSQKALEWASCVEAAPVENPEARIAELVLEALLHAPAAGGSDPAAGGRVAAAGNAADAAGSTADTAEAGGGKVEVSWTGGLTLHLSATLQGDMPYCWTFSLAPLAPQQVLQLVMMPLAVQLRGLTQQLQHKDLQLQQLQRKLADLTPDDGDQLHLPSLDLHEVEREAAVEVRREGIAATLILHLRPSFLTSVRQSRKWSPTHCDTDTPAARRATRPKKLIGQLRPRVAVGAVPMLSETEEMSRRQEIQALRQPPSQTPSQTPGQPPSQTPAPKGTKKKKLKI